MKSLRGRWGVVVLIAGLASTFVGTATAAGSALPTPAVASPGPSASAVAVPVAVFQACVPALRHVRCGTVSVPLDRADPGGRHIAIAFRQYLVDNPPPPGADYGGTVVTADAQPGASNIANAAHWLVLFDQGQKWSFLAIDHRGTGQSQAISCPTLQSGLGDRAAAVRACAAQLGATAGRYGAAAIADDTDAVRQALGIDKIAYYSEGYGAVDVRAYAYRHPDHLKLAILHSPYSSADAALNSTMPGDIVTSSVLVCQRTPTCNTKNPHARQSLEWLIKRVSAHPFTAIGYNANGHASTVLVDESAVLRVLFNDNSPSFSSSNEPGPVYLNQDEIFGAAASLQAGDSTPLLRLVAQNPTVTAVGVTGPISVGAAYAQFCTDSPLPWNKAAPEATRAAQYRAAIRRQPWWSSQPFDNYGWQQFLRASPQLVGPAEDSCVPWSSAAATAPAFPANQVFPASIPVLVLASRLDYLGIRNEQTLIPVFPKGTFFTLQDGGQVQSDCSFTTTLNFLNSRQLGSVGCAEQITSLDTTRVPGIARFPVHASQESPVDAWVGSDVPAGTVADNQIAAAVWHTVLDAYVHAPRMKVGPDGHAHGRGLRGGAYEAFFQAGPPYPWSIDFAWTKFTDDVMINGHATLEFGTDLNTTLTVWTRCGEIGTLTITASFYVYLQPAGYATITGTLNGRHISASAPG